MIAFMYQPVDTGCRFEDEQYGSGGGTEFVDEFMNNSLSYLYANQPIMASADMIQYWVRCKSPKSIEKKFRFGDSLGVLGWGGVGWVE